MFTEEELSVIYDVLEFYKNHLIDDVNLEVTIGSILNKIDESVTVE